MKILLSPDSIHYLRAAEGLRVPVPYSRRFLLPALLGPHPMRWAVLTWASLTATPALAWLYFGALRFVGGQRIFAAALLCALPGVWRCSLRFPVLTDAPAFALALAVATLARSGHPILATYLSLPLGAMRESAPMFAAAWGWDAHPLVGLAAAGWGRPASPPSPSEPWLAHPMREAVALRRRIGLDASLYLRPWGAALLGLVGAPTWQLGAAVALAHAQCLIAVDTIRLTVWCAPVLVASAAKVIPAAWWAAALLMTVVQKDEMV